MTPLGMQYASKALNHWKEWRPNMVKSMRKAGTLNQRAQEAGEKAAEQVSNLMSKGLQQHEAEEYVLPDLVLLKPEKEE